MKDVRPPAGIRLMHALGGTEPDWSAMSASDLAAFAATQNRKRSSPLARLITGLPDRDAIIDWRTVALPDRSVRVRVYRRKPSSATANGHLPLIVHLHGGGFVGTAVQSDWINSHLAARLEAVVVSVEHRLLDFETTLAHAAADGWDVLRAIIEDPKQWGIDPSRAALMGESTGGAIAALAAITARDSGLELRAQVLVNPCVDVTADGFTDPSVARFADSPTLTLPQMEFFAHLAVPDGTDAEAVSPLHARDLSRLAPALVVVPTVDPLSDQGRNFAKQLRAAGTRVRKVEYLGAPHAFLSMPGVVPQARKARPVITEFLQRELNR